MEMGPREATGDGQASVDLVTDSPLERPSGGSFRQLAADPIFVLGHPRSGTTWVYDILTFHPEVAGVLESWLFTPGVGLARLFGDELWAEDRLQRHRETVGQVAGLAQLVTRQELADEVRRLAERLLARALEPQ